MATTQNFDIAIVGGGNVGLTLALALAKNTDLSIAIFEASDVSHPFNADEYHYRVSAVALASSRIFESLGVWDAMQAMRVSPFTSTHVWESTSNAQLDFSCNDISQPLLGHIVENNVMQNALLAKLADYPQIQLLKPITLQPLRTQEDSVLLTDDGGNSYHARLIVAADGARSWVRGQVGIPVERDDYDQKAIVATVETDLPHQKCARQVFLPSGPLAFLPLAESRMSSIVWSLPTEQAEELKDVDLESFRQQLEEAFAGQLGSIKAISKRYTFPLIRQQATSYVKDHVALVGDAAHVMHPLAGQGVNLGLLDAASLAEVIADAHRAGKDYADFKTLRRYERWRRADNLALMTGVDIIKHFFASENPTVKTARAVGISMVNRLTVLKNIFTRYAVGSRDDLPLLAR